jgi:N-acyl-D-amino-acid deacylase
MSLSSRARAYGAILLLLGFLTAHSQPAEYDVILRGGTVYDGSGSEPLVADIAISDAIIAAIGDLGDAGAELEIDATGLAVAPGFINMLSWATESLIQDGRSQSDIRQGVTLEVMGEGNSMGPLNAAMKQELLDRQSDVRYDIEWTTLGEYLEYLVERGVSTNVASFVGAATPRKYVIGYEDRAPTAEELEAMQQIVRDAMREGAMGSRAPGNSSPCPRLLPSSTACTSRTCATKVRTCSKRSRNSSRSPARPTSAPRSTISSRPGSRTGPCSTRR